MKILLLYYTGTGNTRYITQLLKNKLIDGNEIDIIEVNDKVSTTIDMSKYEMIGIGYPIYAFNIPNYFLKYLKKQKYPTKAKYFIYKNSGETYHINDASSISLVKHLKHKGIKMENEYHFIMPYNIHFRFDDHLIKEILDYDNMLLSIMGYELKNNVSNIKKYKIKHTILTYILKIQYIGGPVNSYFYRIDKNKCIDCNKCINTCPVSNIYKNKKGAIKFHHHCIMCMRCSLQCPKDAIKIGFLNNWKVNGEYDFNYINSLNNEHKIINENTKGFFKCYIETFDIIKKRYEEIKR